MVPTGSIIDGRYEVLGSLGDGSQGDAFRVIDLHQNEIVALKLQKAGGAISSWHEATALTQLRDDHILPIRNADLASGVPYLVTELATNGTVGNRLAATGGAGIEPALAVRWTRQVAQATSRTHAAGLLHTDIKPENLFLDDNDNVRLGDYGLASLIDPTGHGHTSGTLTTAAPEVAAALGTPTRSTTVGSDVYSLGATLYWMLTGQPPFRPDPALTVVENAARAAGHTPDNLRDLAPHVPQALAQRVMKTMNPDPAVRYVNAGEFAADLGRIPAPDRAWVRTDEHVGHEGCWRGTAHAGAVVVVCAYPDGARYRVKAIKLPGGRNIRRVGTTCTSSGLPAALRKAFARC